MMKKIDSHQHFWEYDPDRHDWINDQMQVLKRDFMPPDLKKEMDMVGMDGCVAVQADQSLRETEFLLSLADKYDFIEGVIGWIDIRSEDFGEKLDHYMQYEVFKGLRHIVQDEPDDKFLLRSNFLNGIEILGKYNLTYDILIYSRHLPVAVEFVSRFPDQKFVIDHIAKPIIKEQNIDVWEKNIRELAQHSNMYCKVSGMVTEADWENWKADDFKPYLDVVFDAFGADKLMFGSDWPVCKLAAEYTVIVQLLETYLQSFSDAKQDQIMGGNAAKFYDLF